MKIDFATMVRTAMTIATAAQREVLETEWKSFCEYPSNYAMSCVLRVLADIFGEN